MVLVFILCTVVIIITLLICMIILSTLRVNIIQLELSSLEPKNKKAKISFSLYLFNHIKWFSISLNKKRMSSIYNKMKWDNIDMKKVRQEFSLENLRQLRKVKFKFSNFHLDAKLGTEDVIVSSFAVAIISTVVSLLLSRTIKKYDKNKCQYKIVPLYINKNAYEIKFDGIIEIKMVHIINIIYIFLKRRRVNNHEQRTSNRRAYGHSYE